MTASLILACIWALLAGAAAMMPQRVHWPAAVGLIATGLPLIVWIFAQNGPVIGLLLLLAAASVLRWPLIRLLQRLGLLGRDI